jgi:hypothetical protein
MTAKPGIYSIPMSDYQLDPCPQPSLSSSIAHLLCSSTPLHAFTAHPRLNPSLVEEEKEIFDLGTVVHSLLLEGEDIAERLDFPDWRTKAARDARDAARQAGLVPILSKYWPDVEAMLVSTRANLSIHKDARDAFQNGKPEQTLVWEEDGIWCRARLDWLHDDFSYIDDLKTTGVSANPEQVSRTLFTNGLDIQCAFYLRGLKAVTGKEARFRFVFVETFMPYAVSVNSLGPDSMCIAEKRVQWAIDLWRKCLTEKSWPAYPDRTCYARLPAWFEEAWLRKELEA